MQVKLIKGLHVTATNKRHIAQIIQNGWSQGGTKRLGYRIEKIEDQDDMYNVEITSVDSNDYGKKFNRVMNVVVQVKE